MPAPPDKLDDELGGFASHPAGCLEDVGLLRQQVRMAWDAAKSRPIPRSVDIVDRVTEEGLRLRVYRPRSAGIGPALVYCHGGAFLLGFPELEEPGCVRYALGAECTVISVDYRLAPEHPFPAGIEDCFAAVEWVVRNHRELGIDAGRVAVGGASAGGALAAAVALMARDRGAPKLCFQLLVYPVLDDRLNTPSMVGFTDTPVFARRTAEAMWRHYLGPQPSGVSPYAAPARAANLSGLPPAYIEACALDPLRDENIAYATRLLQAGNATELHVNPGTPHGFDQFYLGAPGVPFWPVAAPSSSKRFGATARQTAADEVAADLAAMPQITRRMIGHRIAALRSALRVDGMGRQHDSLQVRPAPSGGRPAERTIPKHQTELST
jgi:acetyl esterase/lipase